MGRKKVGGPAALVLWLVPRCIMDQTFWAIHFPWPFAFFVGPGAPSAFLSFLGVFNAGFFGGSGGFYPGCPPCSFFFPTLTGFPGPLDAAGRAKSWPLCFPGPPAIPAVQHQSGFRRCRAGCWASKRPHAPELGLASGMVHRWARAISLHWPLGAF